MRRLRDFQSVSINLAHAPVDGVVAATSGDIAYLEVDPHHLPEAVILPSRAEVAFLHKGRPIMLTGFADRGGADGLLAFQARGRGQLPNKRATARLSIELTALVAVPASRDRARSRPSTSARAARCWTPATSGRPATPST